MVGRRTRLNQHLRTGSTGTLPVPLIVNNSLYNIVLDPALTAFGPNIDNYVLDAAPGTVFEAGEQSHIPIIAGFVGEEGLIFAPRALLHNSAAKFADSLPLLFGNKTAQALSQPDLYLANTEAQANALALAEIGDLVIAEQTWEAADTQSKTGSCDVYAYCFTYNSTYSPVPAHTAEIPFVFGTLTSNPTIGQVANRSTAMDEEFSKQLMWYWTNFAKTSNPNGAGLPTWPKYCTNCGTNVQNLASPTTPIDYDLDRFEFIKSFRTDGVLPKSWRSINISELNP